MEAALSAGLTAAGLPGATAVCAVLLFRILTFWLPIPVGWGALHYLERRHYLWRKPHLPVGEHASFCALM